MKIGECIENMAEKKPIFESIGGHLRNIEHCLYFLVDLALKHVEECELTRIHTNNGFQTSNTMPVGGGEKNDLEDSFNMDEFLLQD